MFHDPAAFAFVPHFQEHWREIYQEFLRVQVDLIDWYEGELYGTGWKVLGLFDFPHGDPIPRNAERCPVSASLVREHIPGHGAVGFSVLEPGVKVKPHQGYPGDFLRCHLGLRCPEGDCGLRVNGEVRHWSDGGALVFDDRATHEAWNLTGESRVVMLIDFVPEGRTAAQAFQSRSLDAGEGALETPR